MLKRLPSNKTSLPSKSCSGFRFGCFPLLRFVLLLAASPPSTVGVVAGRKFSSPSMRETLSAGSAPAQDCTQHMQRPCLAAAVTAWVSSRTADALVRVAGRLQRLSGALTNLQTRHSPAECVIDGQQAIWAKLRCQWRRHSRAAFTFMPTGHDIVRKLRSNGEWDGRLGSLSCAFTIAWMLAVSKRCILRPLTRVTSTTFASAHPACYHDACVVI